MSNSNLALGHTRKRNNPGIIEELKAAGEELEKAEIEQDELGETKKENFKQRESPVEKRSQIPSDNFSPSLGERKKNWVLLEDYQKTIANEKGCVKEAQKKIEELEKKLKERLEMIEKMEVQVERINKELKDLDQKVVFIKKENTALLLQAQDFTYENSLEAGLEQEKIVQKL